MSALVHTLSDGPGQLVVPAHHGLVLTPADQLDLFADLDAGAEAETARQEAFDTAPSIFADLARGFFARVRAAAAGDEQPGHCDCLRRSHAGRE